MARAGRIGEIVIAGGGIVGWSAAAALRRRLPHISVTLIPVSPPEDALAERIGATLPSIVEFHRDLGLGDTDTILRAGSGYRLGTTFEGWVEGRPDYVHAYGAYGHPFGTASFHHHWVRAAKLGRAPSFDLYAAAAAIGRAGRIAEPQGQEGSPLAGFVYGLALNLPRYREMMRAFARHLGVVERPGAIAEVKLNGEDGFVDTLRLEDGGQVSGHLFIDATGPAAALRGTLDARFESWAKWLPCDRIAFAAAPPPAEPGTLDRVTATATGWKWEGPSPVRTSLGEVYSSAHDEAGKPGAVAIRQGRRSRPWLRNCVAIGDAAVSIEPLEWGNLHLAHSEIDRIIAMMPERDCAEVELWDYNRQSAAEAERLRDFAALHYVTSNRPEPFWREVAAVEPPASLAHTLALFHERGRLPIYEEETFSRDSWAAVLLGQGVIPRRVDPLIETVTPDQSEGEMARMRQAIDAIVPSLPTQTEHLRTLARQASR